MKKKRCQFLASQSDNKLSNKKIKSQISIFIIFGSLLILLIFLFIVILNLQTPAVDDFQRTALAQDINERTLQTYAMHCLEETALPLLDTIAKQGGTLNQTDLDRFHREYYEQKYRTLCVSQEGAQYCVNRILTREAMEKEIEQAILNTINECLNFDFLEERGITVITGDKDIDIRIAHESVGISFTHPISIIEENAETRSTEFYISIPHPLGMMHLLVNDIINAETSKGYFDKDSWMIAQKMQFFIKKHTPYPYVLYEIHERNPPQGKEPRIFSFGLQMEDKASLTSWNRLYEAEYGCCHVRQSCFKNADARSCQEQGGIYIQSTQCECSESFGGNYETEIMFQDCEALKHGESICESQPGIGGRDKKVTCLDGQLVTEMCRDFNEEVCVEFADDTLTRAICKPNRWEDCTRCTTQACCEDAQLRDCTWLEMPSNTIGQSENPMCVPKKSPGFRFWEGAGQEICNLGTGYAQCEGHTCGQEWVTHTTTRCAMLGNCGIHENIAGVQTKSGFLQTDPQIRNNLPQIPEPQFTLHRNQETLLHADFQDTIELIPALLSTGMQYLDDATSGRNTVMSYAFCGVWQQPVDEQRCHLCEGKSCTPYKCYSLGQNCIYSEHNGIPSCQFIEETTTDEIHIELQSEYTSTAETIEIAGRTILGFTIEDQMIPYQRIKLGIETNVPTKCKITYLPHLPFAETPAIWFGRPEFSTTHNVSFRVPERIEISENVYARLEAQNMYEIFRAIIDNEARIQDVFTTGFLDVLNRARNAIQNRPYLKELLTKSIEGLDDNVYHTFIRCTNQAGRENDEPLFIRFQVDETHEDRNPPVIVHTIPSNRSTITEVPYTLRIFTDKPSECKLNDQDTQFNMMPYYFDCETSPLRMSSVGGGSYHCSIETDITKPYIKCMDNPPRINEYFFSITDREQDETEEISYEHDEHNNIILGEHHITAGTTVFMNDRQALYTLSLFIPEYPLCRIGNITDTYNEMRPLSCEPTNREHERYNWGEMNCTTSMLADNRDIKIMCIGETPQHRNVNTESTSLTFIGDDELKIIQSFPEENAFISYSSVRIAVVVNRNNMDYGVNCGYSLNNQPSILQMQTYGSYQFIRDIHNLADGEHTITFRCIDSSGSITEKTSTFYKGT